MKNALAEACIFLFKLLYYSLLQWFLPEKVLSFPIGWDTLHPCAPYSYGGVPRKKFLVLYRRVKNGLEISTEDYHRAEYGTLKPGRKQFLEACERKRVIRKHFSFKKSP